jgi:hypothetical protein
MLLVVGSVHHICEENTHKVRAEHNAFYRPGYHAPKSIHNAFYRPGYYLTARTEGQPNRQQENWSPDNFKGTQALDSRHRVSYTFKLCMGSSEYFKRLQSCEPFHTKMNPTSCLLGPHFV